MAVLSLEDRNRRTANHLLNAAMSYARFILRKYGETGPFGFAMDREGEILRVTMEIPKLPTDPSRLWKLLSENVADRVRRGLVKAVVLAANVNLTEPSAEGYLDAMLLEIEEENGYAVRVTVPYKIYGGQIWNLVQRRIALGNVVAEDGEGRFFSKS